MPRPPKTCPFTAHSPPIHSHQWWCTQTRIVPRPPKTCPFTAHSLPPVVVHPNSNCAQTAQNMPIHRPFTAHSLPPVVVHPNSNCAKTAQNMPIHRPFTPASGGAPKLELCEDRPKHAHSPPIHRRGGWHLHFATKLFLEWLRRKFRALAFFCDQVILGNNLILDKICLYAILGCMRPPRRTPVHNRLFTRHLC